jgi:hypothetical protein
MKILRFLLLLAFSSLLVFTACDSTDPEGSNQLEVETTLKALDGQMAGLGELQESPMLMAALQMPDGLMDVPIVLPKLVQSLSAQNLTKNSANGNMIESLTDTTIQNILEMLDSLYGTHTYTGTEWISDDSPMNQVVIIFPFINLETNSAHIAKIKLHSIIVSQSTLAGDFEIYVDDINQLWVRLEVMGSDLMSETSIPTSIDISGGMLLDIGANLEFSVEMTNSGLEVELGVSGLPKLRLAVGMDNFFESIDSDSDPVPNSISLSYAELELVVNNFDPQFPGDDVGDVFYSGNQVGDLIVEEEGEMYILFNNGEKKNLANLMPNAMGMLSDLEELPL